MVKCIQVQSKELKDAPMAIRLSEFIQEKGNKLPDQLSAHLYFGLNSEPWKYWNILSVFLTANTG